MNIEVLLQKSKEVPESSVDESRVKHVASVPKGDNCHLRCGCIVSLARPVYDANVRVRLVRQCPVFNPKNDGSPNMTICGRRNGKKSKVSKVQCQLNGADRRWMLGAWHYKIYSTQIVTHDEFLSMLEKSFAIE
jgi:hypothetical protein